MLMSESRQVSPSSVRAVFEKSGSTGLVLQTGRSSSVRSAPSTKRHEQPRGAGTFSSVFQDGFSKKPLSSRSPSARSNAPGALVRMGDEPNIPRQPASQQNARTTGARLTG